MEYFAEAEKFHVRIPVSRPMSGSDSTTTDIIENKEAITVIDDSRERGSYQATNAFGAVITADSYDTDIYELAFDPPETIPTETYQREISEDMKVEVQGLGFTVNVGLRDAPKAKENLRLLFIVRPARPFLYRFEEYKTASVDDPSSGSTHYQALVASLLEVWIYDFKSGRILQRIRVCV